MAVRADLAFAAVLALSVFGSGTALARPRDPAAAEVHFRAGREAADRKDFDTACAEFYASEDLDPAIGTRLNLGDCEEHRGRIASAWQFFKDVVRELPADDDRVAFAKERADALEKRLPRLTIRLAPGAGDCEVRRDEALMVKESLGRPLPVDPGEHRIVVSVTDHADKVFRVTLKEGQQSVIDVSPGPAGPRSEKGSSADRGGVSESNRARTTWGFVVGGVGLAFGAAGAVTGVLVLSDKATVDAHCDSQTNRCDSQSGVDAATRGRTLGPVTTALLAASAAGIGLGTYLLVSPGSNVDISAHATGSAATLSVRRRFW
jgi:hypothetical protein